MVAAVSKLMRNQDLIAVARKCRVVTALPHHDRPARPALRPAAAQPPDRRPARHRRLHPRRAALRLRRRGHRHQPGDRQRPVTRSRCCELIDDVRAALRDPHPVLRADPRHDHARGDRARRAGRPGVPVDRRHRGAPTAASASTWPCSARRSDAALSLQPRHGRRQRHVLRDRPGQRALGRAPTTAWTSRRVEARAYAVARAVRAAAGQHRGRLHRPGVPVRRQADHPRRARGPLLRQAARPADGLRRLLHQPRRGRPGRHGHAADAARRGGVQLRHGRARRRRRHAQLPEHVASTTRCTSARCSGCARRRSSRHGCARMGLLDEDHRVRALAPRSPELGRFVAALEAS